MATRQMILRAWHPNTKQLYDVTTISFVREILFGKGRKNGVALSDSLENFVIMEWTGVKDKQNVPIFDGDIVINEDYPVYGIVVFEPGLFVIKYPDNVDILLNNPRNIELLKNKIQVLGNVYENLNILRGGEDKMDNQPTTEPAPVVPVEPVPAVVADTATPAPTPAVEPAPVVPTSEPAVGADVSDNRVELVRERLNDVLVLLREELESKNRGVGARELATALTYLETGCMWVNRSQFADAPYDPRQKLVKAA
jgi:uncharacterized phage protein (TIGR01671 family)